MRFMSTIQAYVPDIQYIEGAKNVVGDTLSRALYKLKTVQSTIDPAQKTLPVMDATTMSLVHNIRLVQ